MTTTNTVSTQLNISQIHRLTGKARSTITNHMKQGKLSFVLDADGNKVVEASEVTRVYGDHFEVDGDGKLKAKSKNAANQVASAGSSGQHLEKLLEVEKKERERERRQLEETIEHLRSDLEKSQERESRATLLLEHQSKDSELWSKQMDEVKKRISSHENEVRKYRNAFEEENRKSWWSRVFG